MTGNKITLSTDDPRGMFAQVIAGLEEQNLAYSVVVSGDNFIITVTGH